MKHIYTHAPFSRGLITNDDIRMIYYLHQRDYSPRLIAKLIERSTSAVRNMIVGNGSQSRPAYAQRFWATLERKGLTDKEVETLSIKAEELFKRLEEDVKSKRMPTQPGIKSTLSLADFEDRHLFAELKRRGYTGELHFNKTIAI